MSALAVVKNELWVPPSVDESPLAELSSRQGDYEDLDPNWLITLGCGDDRLEANDRLEVIVRGVRRQLSLRRNFAVFGGLNGATHAARTAKVIRDGGLVDSVRTRFEDDAINTYKKLEELGLYAHYHSDDIVEGGVEFQFGHPEFHEEERARPNGLGCAHVFLGHTVIMSFAGLAQLRALGSYEFGEIFGRSNIDFGTTIEFSQASDKAALGTKGGREIVNLLKEEIEVPVSVKAGAHIPSGNTDTSYNFTERASAPGLRYRVDLFVVAAAIAVAFRKDALDPGDIAKALFADSFGTRAALVASEDKEPDPQQLRAVLHGDPVTAFERLARLRRMIDKNKESYWEGKTVLRILSEVE